MGLVDLMNACSAQQQRKQQQQQRKLPA